MWATDKEMCIIDIPSRRGGEREREKPKVSFALIYLSNLFENTLNM